MILHYEHNKKVYTPEILGGIYITCDCKISCNHGVETCSLILFTRSQLKFVVGNKITNFAFVFHLMVYTKAKRVRSQ